MDFFLLLWYNLCRQHDNYRKRSNILNKKIRKILLGVWLIIVLNLSICFSILQLIIKEQKNGIVKFGTHVIGLNIFKLLSNKLGSGVKDIDSNTGSLFITCVCIGIYLMISLIFTWKYYRKRIKNLYLFSSIQEVDEMTGIEFEYFLFYKFRQRKYRVKTTPVSGDYGADLLLKKKREKIVVQAKRYQRDVGIAAVQEVIGSIAYYDADIGIVITNSYFTPNAINLAKANQVILWDRKRLIMEFIEEASLENYELEDMKLKGCPRCGRNLIYRSGKYGNFIGCSGYPECNYTTSIDMV